MVVKRIVGLIGLAALGWALARKLLERGTEQVLPAGGAAPGPAAPGEVAPGPAAPVEVAPGPAAPGEVAPGPAAAGEVAPDPPAESGAAPGPAATGGFADNGVADPSAMSRGELYEQAKRLQIEGRSTMSKDELARAVEEARNG